MCELFTISSSTATEIRFSLNEFSKHGGLTNHHRHGWGIAYYSQNSAKIIKEAKQASTSLCLDFIKDYKMQSKIIMSHIRYATQGEVSYRNTQPFARELAGKEHVFIHNGNLNNNIHKTNYSNKRFRPLGETDSETAFCYLMQQMSQIWDAPNEPSLNQRYQVFNYFALEMQTLGIANFIYSDSQFVFIFSDKREIENKQTNKTMILPGLHVLQRKCQTTVIDTSIKGLTMAKKQAKNVILASSVPLNQENWIALESGQSMVFKDGEVVLPKSRYRNAINSAI